MSRAALAAVFLLAGEARAADRHAFELDLLAGYSGRLYPADADPGTTSIVNGGFGGAASVAYHASFFVHPFLDFSWLSIGCSDRTVDLGAYGGVSTAARSLSAWSLMIGPGMDVWQLRFRAGLGIYELLLHTRLLGVTASSSELQFGYLLSAAWLAWRGPPFQVGVEARFGFVTGIALLSGANLGVFLVGATATWDFVSWVR